MFFMMNLLVLIFSVLVADSISGAEYDIDKWEENPAEINVDDTTMVLLEKTEIKRNVPIIGKNMKFGINIYSWPYKMMRQVTSTYQTMRITSIVLHWVPLTQRMNGRMSVMLVDKRFEPDSPNHILSRVTINVNRESISLFYQNNYISIKDISYIDFIAKIDNSDVKRGEIGRVNLGWKTIVGEPSLYLKKDPEVFYLPLQRLPELQVDNPKKVYSNFVKFLKNKHQEEADYFSRLDDFLNDKTFIQNNDVADIIDNTEKLEQDIKTAEKYLQQLNQANRMKEKQAELIDKINSLNIIKSDTVAKMDPVEPSEVTDDYI